jgi:leader peptidase (prepilin peptidase)/N-methyltransferase
MYLIAFFVFIFGTIIGSFLNVVILRYNTGMSIFGSKERSHCFSCGKKLQAHELIPIFSFLLLRGKCSECKSKISWQYPLVEFITGLIFSLIFIKNFYLLDISPQKFLIITLFHFIVWGILMVISFYDLKHKIIPNGLVYALIGITFFGAFFLPTSSAFYLGLGNLIAGLLFFTFFFSLWFFSRGRWVGFGDAKLSLAVGFLLGITRGVSALVLAFWVGAVVGTALVSLGELSRKINGKAIRNNYLSIIIKNLTIKSEIPFAPFIILGTLIAFFMNIDIFSLSSFFGFF